MMKSLTYPLIVLLFSVTISQAQKITSLEKENKFWKVYPKYQYLEDLEELAKTLTETHPFPYDFTSKKEFWRTVEDTKKKITDSTTFGEFIWYCSQIISNIGCSHTQFGWFNQESEILPISKRFPIEARFIENRLYVSDPLVNGGKLAPGEEILSINGRKVSEIQEEIYKHIVSQAKIETYKRILLNAYFTAYISYALGFPDSFQIRIRNNPGPIRLTSLSSYQYKPRIKPEDDCQENLCLKILEEKKTAVMKIRSFIFYGEKISIFRTFIDESFKGINSKNIQNLIIDVRMNGGGASQASTYLLQHISSKPFIYFPNESAGYQSGKKYGPSEMRFQGNIYILQDGDGHSSTGHFLSLVKQMRMATLIGEEAGSNFFCTDNRKRDLKLTHTGISYSVARMAYFTTAQDLPKDKGILPDHYVVQGIEDFLNNHDTVLEYAFNLIEGK
ncbi:S41 family peptidase [Xanthovirga aplysinae]|uniref:S41 family peptidase n=1 Tax=Xanthovirga aplysinae TaxID=2529853 RepID=UPI0012BBA606|nr:S41 family peptidase [Xanthovirga aplysinae]MTI30560.1 peptidase S41 [Xanthovirga aplysinae]